MDLQMEQLEDKGKEKTNETRPSQRLLLIEDDLLTGELLSKILNRKGYETHIATYGDDALQVVEEGFDLIILDLLLPDCFGLDILKALKREHRTIPVLILSGLTTMDNKLEGLSKGADDYLTKPFDHRELLLRVQALLRRVEDHKDVHRIKGVTLNDSQLCLYYEQKRVQFTHKEYLIVRTLLENKDTTITKEALLEIVYPNEYKRPKQKILDVFLFKIRHKLDKATNNHLRIQTYWGIGLKLEIIE